MLRFRPDIKPPMWGPPDAVRFAVRANCERMGMPEPLCFTPCWSVSFGEELVGSTEFYNEGIRTVGTIGSHYFKLPVPQTNLVELYSIYSGELKWSAQPFLSTLSSTNVLRLARMSAGSYRLYGNNGYLSYTNSLVADPVEKSQATWSAGWSQRLRRQRVSITDNTFRSSSVAVGGAPITEVPIGVGEHFRFTWDSKHKFFAFWNVFPTDDVDAHLHFEPYTLLMPVARPVYFDLGATAGTDNLTASDIVTGSPVLGTPTLGQVHALAATGITTSAPVLGTPALGQVHVLTASDLVAGAPVLGSPALAENLENVDILFAQNLVTGAPVLGSPALTQIHALIATDMTVGAPILGRPALSDGTVQPSRKRGGGAWIPTPPKQKAKTKKPQLIDSPTKSEDERIIDIGKAFDPQPPVKPTLEVFDTPDDPSSIVVSHPEQPAPTPLVISTPEDVFDDDARRIVAQIMSDVPGMVQEEAKRVAMMRMRDEDEVASLIMIFASV